MKACIFDLDGVLVDTAKYHFIAWQRLAESLGFSFTEIQNEELKGISRMDSLDKLLTWGAIEKTEEEKLALASLKNDWYVEMISEMKPDELLPGTQALLSELKNKGKKIALGSASKNAPMILEKTGINSYFDAVVDGNSVSKSKPDPEVFLLAAKLVGAEPQDCLVFEDAKAGVEAGKRADMKVIGIGNPKDLEQADLTVKSLEEVNLDLLENKI